MSFAEYSPSFLSFFGSILDSVWATSDVALLSFFGSGFLMGFSALTGADFLAGFVIGFEAGFSFFAEPETLANTAFSGLSSSADFIFSFIFFATYIATYICK